MKKTVVAVVGDPEACAHIIGAVSGARPFDSNETLEPLDEFSARRWFARNTPSAVFICVGRHESKTVNAKLLASQGALNMLNAAIGFSDRIGLVGSDCPEFSMLKELGLLYQSEKGVNFQAVPRQWDIESYWAARCVLSMGVSATKKKESSTEGQGQGGEVRDSVLPQSTGDQQHRSFTATLLEVPLPSAAQEARGDLRSEPAATVG